MRVLYFGTYERNYPRNAQVISALRTAGVEVVEHHEPVYEARRDNWAVRWTVALRLFVAEMRLRYSSHDAFDVVLVGYPGPLRRAARATRRRASGRSSSTR